MVLSCLPSASQAVLMALPASLVPPWCLAGCPMDPFLPASQAVQMVLSCLPGAAPVSKCFSAASRVSVAQGFRGTDSSSKGPRGLATRVDSRFWTGAGFCLSFSTTSMANSPVRGKSWGGPHGRLPVAQAGL